MYSYTYHDVAMRSKGWTAEASESQQRIHCRLTRPASVLSNLALENLGTENGAMAEVKYAAAMPGTNSRKDTSRFFSPASTGRCGTGDAQRICRTGPTSVDRRSTWKSEKQRIRQTKFTANG